MASATKIVATEALPILWSFRRCPYAIRARLAIVASGQSVVLREIKLRDKPAAFVAASPKATVPVLVLCDGTVVEESRDVMFWALTAADPDGWLDIWHRDPDRVDAFFEQLDGPFKHHLDRYKYAYRYGESGKAEAEMHRREGAAFLARLDQELAAGGALSPASSGGPGLLDHAALPFVRQFRLPDERWFDAQPWPHLHRWLSAFLESDAFRMVMQNYAVWQEGEAGAPFPPAPT